jgi:hypothetical protein
VLSPQVGGGGGGLVGEYVVGELLENLALTTRGKKLLVVESLGVGIAYANGFNNHLGGPSLAQGQRRSFVFPI